MPDFVHLKQQAPTCADVLRFANTGAAGTGICTVCVVLVPQYNFAIFHIHVRTSTSCKTVSLILFYPGCRATIFQNQHGLNTSRYRSCHNRERENLVIYILARHMSIPSGHLRPFYRRSGVYPETPAWSAVDCPTGQYCFKLCTLLDVPEEKRLPQTQSTL